MPKFFLDMSALHSKRFSAPLLCGPHTISLRFKGLGHGFIQHQLPSLCKHSQSCQGELQMAMIAECTSFQEPITKDKVMQIVEKGLELAKMWIFTEINSLFKDRNQTSARNNMKLEFRNKISQEILTGEEIKGEGNTPIEVALVDDSTGNIVDVGPEASASVEIILLKGEADALEKDHWTVEEFNKNIVPEVKDKKPLLAGKIPLKLQGGIVVVEDITIRHHASKIGLSKLKLGARVVGAFGGHHISEAKTRSFTLKDFRRKYSKKHKTPSLSDEVFRLVNIGKGGDIEKRLRADRIKTVEDFLIRLLINPDGLKTIVKLCRKRWEATVENARACLSNTRMYCYINLEQKMGIVFNVFGQALGLYIESQYSEAVSENQKAQELLASAYEDWENVKSFDDMNSLRQYFTDLSTHMDLDSVQPEYPAGGQENNGTSERVGESSSWHSKKLDHTAHSTMNLTRETGGDDFNWLSTTNGGFMHSFGETSGGDIGWFNNDNRGIMYDHMQLSPGWSFSMLQDDYEYIQQNYSCNMQLDGLMDGLNADERGAATAVTFDESQAVHSRKSPKRWKKLFCVSKWFSIMRKVSPDAHKRKKPKVG